MEERKAKNSYGGKWSHFHDGIQDYGMDQIETSITEFLKYKNTYDLS